MNAAMAIFHSKAIDRYSTITIRKAISASSALPVIWLPQLGPTVVTLMLFVFTPSLLDSAFSSATVSGPVSALV